MDASHIVTSVATLAAAYALALPIGWNRERAERSAGLRTFPLVALAACGFILAAEAGAATSPDALARIIQGVALGVGFIGGGAILKTGETVHGAATAASLWATAAIGSAAALGAWEVAVAVALMTFLTLKALPPLEPEESKSDT
ncbi:MAG: MgtC/SapB family protein [Methylocystis sp.]|uniref:MgtC/SapB family protein n=1 Tax=Methylocystis sp. TaxID=1911079 RepID=UPI003DA3C706